MPLDIVRIFALLTGAVIIVLLLALWGYRFAVTSRRRRKTGVVSRYRSVLHRMAECDPEDLEGLQKAMEGVPPGDRETLVESLARVKDTPLSTYSRLLDALGVTDRYVERVRRARGWKERAMAAEALGRIGSARAVPALLEVVRDRKDEDEEVRGVALRALGRIRDERAIPFLIEALGDEESWIPPRVAEIIHAFGREAVPYLVNELKNYENATRRMWAAEILGWIGEKSAASPLLDALGDVNPEVRAKAAGALGRLKDPRAIPRLVEMLVSDPVPFVRVRTAQALGQIGHPSIIDYLVNILRDPEWWVRVRAVEALEQMGQPAIPSLLAALEDEDEEVRKKAAQALERMGYVERVMAGYGEEEFRPELRKILFLILKAGVTESISERVLTSEGILQKRLIRLLGEAGEKKSAGVLVELLRKTDDWTLQSRIIQSLGNMGAREAAHYLVGFLRSEHYWVRRATVEALEKIGAVEYATHVSELLRDPNPMARESAATALAAMGVREAWQKIVPLLDDPVPEVRAAALEAVRKLGGDLTPEKVRSLLRDTSSAVRKEGLTFAADRGMREVVEDAVKSLLSGDEGEAERAVDYLRRTGSHPFSTIVNLLGGEGDDRILPLLRAASVTKSPEAEEFIRKKITHSEGAVRSAAYRALISSGAAKEGDLLSGLRDPDEEVRFSILREIAFRLPGKEILEKVVSQVEEDPSPGVRILRALVAGLGNLENQIPSLRRGLYDGEERVRAASALSLALLGDESLAEHLFREDSYSNLREAVVELSKDPALGPVVDEARKRGEHAPLELGLILTDSLYAYAGKVASAVKESLDPSERRRAVKILSLMGAKEHTTVVLSAMKRDPAPEVRMEAVEAVASLMEEKDAVTSLVVALSDPATSVRCRAAEVLSRFVTEDSVAALLHCLDTADREFRESVTTALSRMLARNPDRVKLLLGSVPEEKTRKIGLIWLVGKMGGKGSIRFLTEMLEDPDHDVRASAVGALAKFKRREVFNRISRLLNDPNERVRAASVNAVTKLAFPEAEELLEQALLDVDDFVKMRAAVGLVRLRGAEGLERVREAGKGDAVLKDVCRALEFALGITHDFRVGDLRWGKQIVAEFNDLDAMREAVTSSPSEEERVHALRVLALLDAEGSRAVVESALEDPSGKVREEAERIINR